jgi:hypothetical protein
MSIEILWIGKGDVERVWPKVEPFLVSALKRWLPVYFSADLLEMVKKDELQLWIITDTKKEILYGAGLTEIRNYPRAKILNLFMLGGKEMKRWVDQWSDAMELFARSQNCDFLQCSGRRGWARIKGAFESAVIVNKILT